MKLFVIPLLVLGGLADAAVADDRAAKSGSLDGLGLTASIGHLSGVAHETVYNEDGSKVSELVWNMQDALALNGGIEYSLSSRFVLYGNASVGLSVENEMDNYDWVALDGEELVPNPPPAPPGLHSWHDDTDLDHYYALDVGVSFAALDLGANRFSLLGGFKYTDVAWTASGGCYDYLGYEGCFADGEKGITYRQSLPAVYGGIGYEGSLGAWTLSADGRAGVTLGADATDDHWMRDLRFVDKLGSAPYVALNGRLSYAVSESVDLVAAVAYDEYFERKGETHITDTMTGESGRTGYDSGGGDFYTVNVSLGAAVSF